jgi:homoserine kinase
MQRLAVLTTALGQAPPDPELIYEAMKDRVHQPYRKLLVCFRSVDYERPI